MKFGRILYLEINGCLTKNTHRHQQPGLNGLVRSHLANLACLVLINPYERLQMTKKDERKTKTENFDHLSDAAYVDVRTVAELFGCKVPTVWARLRRDELPAPKKFGAHTRWNVGQLREQLAAAN